MYSINRIANQEIKPIYALTFFLFRVLPQESGSKNPLKTTPILAPKQAKAKIIGIGVPSYKIKEIMNKFIDIKALIK